MIIIICIAIVLLMIFSVFVRTILLNPHYTLYYFPQDIYHYFRYKLYNEMATGKLICYTALFGGGKTLSCVHYVNHLYDKYNDKKIFDIQRKKWVTQKVHIISNVRCYVPEQLIYMLKSLCVINKHYVMMPTC